MFSQYFRRLRPSWREGSLSSEPHSRLPGGRKAVFFPLSVSLSITTNCAVIARLTSDPSKPVQILFGVQIPFGVLKK